MSGSTARVVRIARLPQGRVQASDFAVAEVPLPDPAPGEAVVRNTWMSVDPYMRLALTGLAGVHPPAQLGDVLGGAAVGVVERSAAPDLPEGATVMSQKAWRDRFTASASTLTTLGAGPPPQAFLGVLGLTGITAYGGIERVLKPKPGESVLVSGAAGAVGSLACQLAKRRGARVIGTAGSRDKLDWLTGELKVDVALDYHDADLAEQLKQACPSGVDHYFDNVGGPMLDLALGAMKPRGRIAVCGSIALYEGSAYRAGPADFFTIVEKGLEVIGFNAGLYGAEAPQIVAELAGLLSSGELVSRETVVEGLENAPAAFAALFTGGNTGKMLVHIG